MTGPTALDGIGCHLQCDKLAAGLRYADTEHQADTCVFTSDIRLAFPQLDIRVLQLQDAHAVDTAKDTGMQLSGRYYINND